MLEKLLSASVHPFSATPDTRFYFDHPSIESARQTILRAVIRAEGPVVVLGGSGYGKSLLASLVADQLCQRMDIVMLQSARLSSRRALLQSILFELKLPYLNMSEGELRLSILDRLEPSPETAPEGVLILVDEAQSLHWKLLDELRLISNFARNHQPRVKLVLFGNMRLEETLASPQLDSFNQRLAGRCYLQPMSRSETAEYIQHQLRDCGIEPSTIITQDAINCVYSASEGIPRLVNQLMDHSIWLASNSAQLPISAALMNDAWSDLQQLPTPWSTGKSDQAVATSSIEFGNLPEDDDDHEELGFAPTQEIRKHVVMGEGLSQRLAEQTSTANTSEQFQPAIEFPSVVGLNNWSPIDADQVSNLAAELNSQTTQLSSKLTDGNSSHDCVEVEDNNFFAAFQTLPSGQFLKELAESAEDDAWRVQAAQPLRYQVEITLPAAEATEVPQAKSPESPIVTATRSEINWFVSSAATNDALEGEIPYSSSDHERIVNLMAEQQQYDAMGVWENDPPLASQPSSRDSLTSAIPPSAVLSSDANRNVFGDDFEDEMIVANESAIRGKGSHSPAGTQESRSNLSGDDGDYLARMQKYADALNSVAQSTKPQADFESERTEDGSLLSDALWQIDVNVTSEAVAGELPLEEAIEDIVSQLNFSAFTTEPYSLEQIPLEPAPKSVPFDSIRRGENNEVYFMHRPLSQANPPIPEPVSDDRDLLVVEEDVPVSMRTLDTKNSQQPAQKTTPYAQLFAKLRK